MAVNEYICRIIGQADGKEPVPQSAQEAQNNNAGKGAQIKNTPSKSTENGKNPNTKALFNSALQVAMPALNAFTNGIGGQVLERTRNVINLGTALATGAASIGSIVGAATPLASWAVGKIVSEIVQTRNNNNAIAEGIRNTNDLRASVGLSTLDFSQRGLTRKITVKGVRGQ